MNNVNELVREYRDIRKDYEVDLDIMSNEPERLRKIKYIINYKLSVADRTILLLYVDCQSLRKVGAKMGVSHATIRNEILRIKNILFDEYAKRINDV